MKIYPPDPITGKSAFVRARVIGDYNYLYKKCVELKGLVDELSYVNGKNREEGAVRRQVRVRSGLRCFCCGVKRDEAHYLQGKVTALKQLIRVELNR